MEFLKEKEKNNMLKINRDLEIALATLELLKMGGTVRVQDIAEKTQSPRAFLDRIVWKLTKAGITKSRRGPGGGVSLAKEKVTVLELGRALGYEAGTYQTQAVTDLSTKINDVLATIEV
jgi:DNA-binding IscR family transcriptional regulator